MSVFKDKEKTKDGRQWRFKDYYHNSEGKLVPYVSKRYMSEKEAKAEEKIFLLNRNKPVKKQFGIIADEYFKDAKTRLKESTLIGYMEEYNLRIKKMFEKKFIDEIKVADIETWKNSLPQNLSILTLNNYYKVFNEIFKFANRKYELNYNPVKLSGCFKKRNDKVIETESKLKYLTYDEFSKFISYVDNDLWHCFFIFLFFTGMRRGEVLALTWNDINFEKNIIKVNKNLTYVTKENYYKITSTKTNQNREIIMSKKLRNELISYNKIVKQYSDFSNNWFVFGNGLPLSYTKITNYKKKYFKKAGMQKEMITTHEFRHSHVSLCINEYLKSGQTDSLKFFLMMSQRMGHTVPVMQKTYMHLFPSAQEKIVDLLDNL